mmetsp:Transcript_6929/g.12973  ORF Transcript_6929/g.12973 Transcript_6929/m.12973 type:complete len:210 (+) Transcript_6929:1401-2030(+)
MKMSQGWRHRRSCQRVLSLGRSAALQVPTAPEATPPAGASHLGGLVALRHLAPLAASVFDASLGGSDGGLGARGLLAAAATSVRDAEGGGALGGADAPGGVRAPLASAVSLAEQRAVARSFDAPGMLALLAPAVGLAVRRASLSDFGASQRGAHARSSVGSAHTAAPHRHALAVGRRALLQMLVAEDGAPPRRRGATVLLAALGRGGQL